MQFKNRSRRLSVVLIIGLVSMPPLLCAAQEFREAMRTALGSDYRHYQWLDYPLNNFGVVTSYKGHEDKIDRGNFLCATWSCLNKAFPSDSEAWMKVEGYVDYGCGGKLADHFNQHRQQIATAVLPQLLTVLGITADFQRTKDTQVDMEASTVCSRLLQQDAFLHHLITLDPKDDTKGLKNNLLKKNLVLVVGDIVIKSMTLSVKPNSTLKADFDAKLQQKPSVAISKTQSPTAAFGVQVQRGDRGNYELSITDPVIAAVLAKHQDPARSAGVVQNVKWQDWKRATVEIPTPEQLRGK